MIATKLATSIESVGDYMAKTLLQCSADDKNDPLINQEELSEMVRMTIQDMESTNLIKRDNFELQATTLGQAIVASSLAPEDGIFVHKELSKALQAFVMDGEMHVLYAFTPVQATQSAINWKIFLLEVEAFDESNMRALSFVGLKPTILNKM